MRQYFFLLGLIVGLQSCSNGVRESEEKKHYVVLMAGQSNMVGHGKVSEIDSIRIPENILYFNGNRSDFRPNPRTFGPEVSVMKMLGDTHPDLNFIIIKYALGGTSLLDWAPDYSVERAKITEQPQKGNLYNHLMTRVDSITENYDAEFLALLWMQGGRDARFPQAAREYEANFRNFIRAIRDSTSTENLPVIFGLINTPVDRYPETPTVRSAQKTIAAQMENVYMIDDNTLLEKWEDNVHYSTQGQIDLGKKFAAQLLEIIEARKL